MTSNRPLKDWREFVGDVPSATAILDRFLHHEGVEPTNNAGERSLRHAVIWRKLSLGTQSANGSRFVETMLTVVETCRQQDRNAFAFLTDAVNTHLIHQPAPSLLPGV